MSHEMPSESMQRCIDLCRRCHEACLRMFLRHCVEVGGAFTVTRIDLQTIALALGIGRARG